MRTGPGFLAFVLAAAVASLASPALATTDTLVTDQWYTATYEGAGSPLTGLPFSDARHGPLLGGGFADSIDAPTGNSWTITLSTAGTLTVADVGDSAYNLPGTGDQYQLFDNGVAMTPAASPFHKPGQNPGQAGLALGLTSTPGSADDFFYDDINASLGDSNFSSGTFALSAGTHVITGVFVGTVAFGDVAFIVEPAAAPEPAGWMLMTSGVGAIGAGLRARRRRYVAA